MQALTRVPDTNCGVFFGVFFAQDLAVPGHPGLVLPLIDAKLRLLRSEFGGLYFRLMQKRKVLLFDGAWERHGFDRIDAYNRRDPKQFESHESRRARNSLFPGISKVMCELNHAAVA